ncbi:MAG: VOC family protein [Bacteroidota bacterium]|nr:VOC family protein [Bacteroidota bacterium]
MKGLRTLSYRVSDLAKAKQWCSKAFETQPYFDEPYDVGFNIGGYELGLQPGEKSVEDCKPLFVTFWGVDDIVKEYNRLLALGAKPHETPLNEGGELPVAFVLDPPEQRYRNNL